MSKVHGPFGQSYRMRFIEKMLMHYGIVNRSVLADYFGISTPQASHDIQAYIQLAPGNLEYDKTEKAYVRSEHFVQVYE